MVLSLAAVALLLTGCERRQETVVGKLVVRSGELQTGEAGSECAKPLAIEVLGPVRRGALGGKGRRLPVSGVSLRFRPLGRAADGLTVSDVDVTTDVAGVARTTVTLGQRPGDQYVEVSCPSHSDVSPLVVRFVAGIDIYGSGQETVAGDELPEPLKVRVTDAERKPVAGVPVYFTLPGSSAKAKLNPSRALTDENGLALTQLSTDPKLTGRYDILVEVSDPETGCSIRGVPLTALAMNRLQLLIGVLGGLGIFIFGMKLMSDGLQQIAGGRLKQILRFLTRNRVAAVLAGLVVTAFIQSSSACTVMVVGFVNAGLLTLKQAIGIIYGAAIGTTVTAQMVSFKLDGLALPCICIGVTMALFSRRSYMQGIGNTVLGFGLLFFGMGMMSHDLKAIADFPSFVRFFRMFDCSPNAAGVMPIGAVLGAITVGTVVTMIVQSSSATVGLVIALAVSGLVDFHTAVPLVLGDNIGTTITAILASISTNRSAKQAALANTIFKTLGVVVMVAGFYIRLDGQPAFLILVDKITVGDVFAETPENIGRHVAAAHTLFNIMNVILFLPFVSFVAWVARTIIPVEEEGVEPTLALEPHLLGTPSVGIRQAISELVTMTRDAVDQTDTALEAFISGDLTCAEPFARKEDLIDKKQHDIIRYLVELTRQHLTENQSEAIPVIMHCVNDVERIGDRATNLLELARAARDLDDAFSGDAMVEIRSLGSLIDDQAKHLLDAVLDGSDSAMMKALKIEGEINTLTERYERNHEERLRNAQCTVRKGIIFVELIRNLERIADHLSNLAERSPELYSHQMELGKN